MVAVAGESAQEEQGGQLGWPCDVFDELNIAEIPFAPLTHDTRGIPALFLSQDQRERIVPDRGGLLPNPLAERAVLALMWLSRDQFALQTRVVRFPLRELVCNYMFPGRYSSTYNPSQKILRAVEEQLNRVAFTRLVTDRWFDRKLGQHTPLNAAVIDYIQVVDPGGRNRPRLLEISWGTKFFESLVQGYTRALEPSILARIEHPLDLRLYRLLNKRLSHATSFKVTSVQQFNRGSLAMSGRTIDVGGRRASTYIAARLSEAVERLTGIGYRVRMVVDTARPDFSLEFLRLEGEGPNEVVEDDRAGELVRHFYLLSMGPAPRRRVLSRDRDSALQWLEHYGYDTARRLVSSCIELQRKMGREEILSFAGLAQYESRALGRVEHVESKSEGQLPLKLEEDRESLWRAYRAGLRVLAQDNPDFVSEAERQVEACPGYQLLGPNARRELFASFLTDVGASALNGMTKEQFCSASSVDELRASLRERHGRDLLDTVRS